jgi:hypothetical protein
VIDPIRFAIGAGIPLGRSGPGLCHAASCDGAMQRSGLENLPTPPSLFMHRLTHRYRSQLCNDGAKCKRKICFFAHTMEELRTASVSTPASLGSGMEEFVPGTSTMEVAGPSMVNVNALIGGGGGGGRMHAALATHNTQLAEAVQPLHMEALIQQAAAASSGFGGQAWMGDVDQLAALQQQQQQYISLLQQQQAQQQAQQQQQLDLGLVLQLLQRQQAQVQQQAQAQQQQAVAQQQAQAVAAAQQQAQAAHHHQQQQMLPEMLLRQLQDQLSGMSLSQVAAMSGPTGGHSALSEPATQGRSVDSGSVPSMISGASLSMSILENPSAMSSIRQSSEMERIITAPEYLMTSAFWSPSASQAQLAAQPQQQTQQQQQQAKLKPRGPV